MENTILKQVMVCDDHDRVILVEKDRNGFVTNLDFVQDASSHHTFEEGIVHSELTRFYNEVKHHAPYKECPEIERINQIMWLWHTLQTENFLKR